MEKYLVKLTRAEYEEKKSEDIQALRQERAHDRAVKKANTDGFVERDLARKRAQATERKQRQRAREQVMDIEAGRRNTDGSLRKKVSANFSAGIQYIANYS